MKKIDCRIFILPIVRKMSNFELTPIPFANNRCFGVDNSDFTNIISKNVNESETKFSNFLEDEANSDIRKFINKKGVLHPDPEIRNMILNSDGVCSDCTASSIISGESLLCESVNLPGVINRNCKNCFVKKYIEALENERFAKIIVQFVHDCAVCKGKTINCTHCVKRNDSRQTFCSYCRNQSYKCDVCHGDVKKRPIIQRFAKNPIEVEFTGKHVKILGIECEFEYLFSDDFEEILSGFGSNRKLIKRGHYNDFTKYILVIHKPVIHDKSGLILNGYFPGVIQAPHVTCINAINNVCHGIKGHREPVETPKGIIAPSPFPIFFEKSNGGISINRLCIICLDVENKKKQGVDYRHKKCSICANIKRVE